MSVNGKSGHAIVLGGSFAGLLAARVLSETHAKVTVFDRDVLPEAGVDRKGVPQGEHTHGLLARGRQVLEELFDGFIDDITALGAVTIDIQNDVAWVNDGHRLRAAASDLRGLGVSRPALEGYVRRRVREIANVQIKDRHEVLGLLATEDRRRVRGVRVLPAGAAQDESLEADLVIDATGRGNRGPTWLAAIGYDQPVEERVDAGTTYLSRNFRRTAGQTAFSGLVVSPSPNQPHGGVAVAVEGDRWMVTLIGVGPGQAPPSDPDGFLEFVRKLPTSDMYDLLLQAEPIGPPMKLRLPVSVRRRYERMNRLPAGFLAVGDAFCAFNPAYGQGLTAAAEQAMVLRRCVAAGRDGLPRRFFASAAKVIDVPWDIAVGADLRYQHVAGPRSRKTAFLNGYVAKLHVAAERHPKVGHAFLAVANMMAPPQKLFSPGVLARVLFPGRSPQARPAIVAPAADLESVV